MRVAIPEFCLVVLVGASGSGKTTFARRHFAATETISSDACRAMVSDDANDQSATKDAFEVLNFIAAKRLAARRLTVIDATNVRAEDRRGLVRLAREYHAHAAALVFDLPERICQERNAARADRTFGSHVVRNQTRALRRGRKSLRREGFRYQFRFDSEDEVNAVEVERQRLWTDQRHEHGPFDIIGDLHGCFAELCALLDKLGYHVERSAGPDGDRYRVSHPAGRRLIFLGDLVDRGPGVVACLRLVMDAVADRMALCVPGNHEVKLTRKLRGRNVTVSHGLAESIAQLDAEPPAFRDRAVAFMDGLVSHFELDDGNLVVAHAGMKEAMQGRSSRAVRDFALFGETTGETDEFGLPVRYDWAADYRGTARVVYGHTPVPAAEWLNRTICIDTGCVFGGSLTALRYPERELVSVPAARTYFEPVRPLAPEEPANLAAQHIHDHVLDMDDVLGKRIVATGLAGNVTIREENATAALEVMARFAVDAKWLIYLPPTMAPCDTATVDGLLEHPLQAFDYYRRAEVSQVVCEEKHMGSRTVVVVCRDAAVAERRFGIADGRAGSVYTRTGRAFFDDGDIERAVLARLLGAMDRTRFWDRFATDWACLDCELMPWSAKAQALLDQQYEPVAEAAELGLGAAVDALERASASGVDCTALLGRYRDRQGMTAAYAKAFRRYCWPVTSVDDLRLAPFHLLATEGAVHGNRDHGWHIDVVAALCAGDESLLVETPFRVVDVDNATSRDAAVAWWQTLTDAGGEGMVVKPWSFVAKHRDRLVQPALKVRGREYLRIIYGPEYTAPEHLARLRQRALGRKRALALREFALGIEGLERFVAREPLRRVHECAFAVLALESEPVDSRL